MMGSNFLDFALRLPASIWAHPANRGRRIRALIAALTWQVKKRISRNPVRVGFSGYEMICHSDSHAISPLIYFSGASDYDEIHFLRRYLRPGDGFIDVGANEGIYTLQAAVVVGPAGRVTALEPAPPTFRRLVENVRVNHMVQVEALQLAAADQPGVLKLFDHGDACTGSLAPSLSDRSGVDVQVSTLDALIGERRYAMGKMDIEGAEPLALSGAVGQMAACNPPVWQLEAAGYSKRFGVSTHRLIEQLELADYLPFIYQADQNRLIYARRPWEHGRANIHAIARKQLASVAARVGCIVPELI